MAQTNDQVAPAAPAPTPPAAPPAPVTPEAEAPPGPDVEPDTAEADDDTPRVTWTASEFIAHEKSPSWYLLLAVAAVVAAGLVFVLTRDLISVGVILIAASVLGIYASHKPRQLDYVIDGRGIGIGQKYHMYEEFKSFAVVPEGAFSSVVFMPLKRFAVPLTIYYAPADEEAIMAILSDQLPLEEHRLDPVDNLFRRIRF